MNKESKGWSRRRQFFGEALQTLVWLLITAGLIWAVLYGKKLTLFAAMALVMIQIFWWILFHTAFGSKTSSGGSRFWFSKKQGICMWSGLSLLFFLAMMIVLFKPSFFYNLVFGAEGYASGRIQQLMGRKTMIGGDIDRGNNYRIGTKQLEVFLTELPGEPLYLKGFSGGNYQGSRWETADDEALFEETAKRLNWKRWASIVGGMYRSMYFVLNYDTRRAKPPVYREMYIQPFPDSSEIAYVPYYSRDGGMEDKDRDEWKEGQRYQYFEQRDMDILWNGQSNGLGEGRVWYRQLQAEYLKAAERAYTQVPSELLPKMTQLVWENPRDSLDEITAFIRQTLEDRASYTLTPGWTPLNQDVVEYFLFENGQGYCQHFATAAVLMYRMYGIPARYAAGYVLYPSDFSK